MKGHVQWTLIDKATGAQSLEYEAENTITFLATNIMAKSIAGLPDYKITHIYGEHADPGGSGYIEGSLNGLSSMRADTIADLQTSPRSTAGAEEPVLVTNFSTTTENPPGAPVTDYTDNIATFTAIFSDPSLDGRIFVGAGLMTLVAGTELLFAHQYRPALIKLSSFDIQVAWSVRYL
jgi:hypothetical protein